MKGFTIGTVLLTLLFGISSCKKDPPLKPDAPTPSQPTPKPQGTPVGPKVSTTIGPNGGSFHSLDNSITVTIPAGAVSENTVFSLQEISNTCAAGIGKSFRLEPHGKTFSKPVQLKFSYHGHESELSLPEVLSIATQDEAGIWRMMRGIQLNREEKYVTVPTTHFSNWTLMSWLQLKPVTSIVAPGAQLDLQVYSYIPLDENLLTPLVPPDLSLIGVGEGQKLDASFIKEWKVVGPGSIAGNGSAAKYTAPATVTKAETATVTAALHDPVSTLLMIATVKIIPDGIVYRIGGGEWQQLPGWCVKGNDQFNLTGVEGERYMAIDWPGGKGSFSWLHNPDTDKGEKAIGFVYTNVDGLTYKSTIYDEEMFKDSGGSLVVDEFGEKNSYVTGHFSIAPSAFFRGIDDTKEAGRTTVEGFFRVKRIN